MSGPSECVMIVAAQIYSEYFKGRKHVDNFGAMATTRFNGSQRNEVRDFKTGFMWFK